MGAAWECQQLARRELPTSRSTSGAHRCRRTSWASCSTSRDSPMTSLQWRRRACSATLWLARSALLLGEVVTFTGHTRAVRQRWRCPTATSSPVVVGRVRQGVARRGRERTIRRTSTSRVRCCRRGALRQRLDRRTAKLWTLNGALGAPRWAAMAWVAALPDGVHFMAGLQPRPQRARSGCTTSTGRLSTPHGAHPRCARGGGDADGQHIVSGSRDKLVKAGVAQELREQLRARHQVGGAPAPDAGSMASGTGPSARGRRRTPRTPRHSGRERAPWRRPTSARLRLLDNTVKLANVNDDRPRAPSAPQHHVRATGAPAAARRPPLRQRLGRRHRPHRLPRPAP